jgi:hypothetical protein
MLSPRKTDRKEAIGSSGKKNDAFAHFLGIDHLTYIKKDKKVRSVAF